MQYMESELKRLQEQHDQGDGQLRVQVITGKGNHSMGGVARIRPQVEGWLKQRGIKHKMQNDGGAFVVNLSSWKRPRAR